VYPRPAPAPRSLLSLHDALPISSLVIFEDLDRLYGQRSGRRDNLTKVTLQHLLNCLDGLGSRDGVLVVGTANDPTVIDAAIVRRDRKSTRLNSSHDQISYAVFCL